MMEELLRIDDGILAIHDLKKLNGINLNLFSGEAVGLIFANLHEKEALLQIMRGQMLFDAGDMYCNGKLVTAASVIKQSVYVINKKAVLNEFLSICENVYYDRLPFFLWNLSPYEETIASLFEQFGIEIDIKKPVEALSHLEKISVELMTAYMQKKRIIVLADLSYYLTGEEIAIILKIVSQLKLKGFGVLLIDSFWDSIFQCTERIAIIQYGKTIGFFHSNEVNSKQLQLALLQDYINTNNVRGSVVSNTGDISNTPRFTMDCLNAAGLYDINIKIEKGTLGKIVYFDEASFYSFMAVLTCQSKPTSGLISINGKKYFYHSEEEAQKKGIYILPDDPQEKMLFQHMSVYDNIAFFLARKQKGLWRKHRYRQNVHQLLVKYCEEDFWSTPLTRLSPVQKHKLLYLKYIACRPELLICVNPFTGMDYQVDKTTQDMMIKILNNGTSILLLTSFLPLIDLPGSLYYLEHGCLTSQDEFQ